MNLYTLSIFLPLAGVLMFEQNQYMVIFERVEVIRYNTKYMGMMESHNFKINRTHTAVNVTYERKIDLGNAMNVEIQAYKFTSNEYRDFPLRVMFNCCEVLSKNEFGSASLFNKMCDKHTDGCPFKKGVYHTCNWAPDSTKFPPLLPKGRYMVDLKFFHQSDELFFLQAYGEVKYPELCRKC